jgi:prepilin-type processing-associated H-X9-DG protein/prepilin-type N-terminal cleavage/methylation domain-containing protein
MKRPAFTLVEMLVVIATIALLMAILLPSLHRSKQQAQAVLCNLNIKQLLYGLFSYENENQASSYGFCVELDDEYKPIKPPGGYPGNSALDRRGWWWFNYISDYNLADKQTLWCPSRQIRDTKFKYILYGNYGVNRSIFKSCDDRQPNREEFIGTPLRSSNISRSSETLLLVDSGYAIISWWHATDKPPVIFGKTYIEDTAYVPGLWINKNRILWPGQERDAINGRHPNKTVNVGFADGHTSLTKADNLFVEKTDDGYKNKSPLWAPK